MSGVEVYRRPAAVAARAGSQPPPGSPQWLIDNWLPEGAKRMILRGKSPHTLRAYNLAFNNWWRPWAEVTKVTILPSTQNSMIRFIHDWESLPVHVGCTGQRQPNGEKCTGHRPSPSALYIWYSAMKFIHGLGDPPLPWEGGVRLSEAMAGYIAKIKEDGWRETKAPRAYPDHVKKMVTAVREAPDTLLQPARRDMIAAVVLAGFYTGGRVSDLARYRLGDITYFPGGIEFVLAQSKARRGKRGQEERTIHRSSNPEFDGVAAVDRWVERLRDNDITTGALFRPVHKSGTIVRGRPDAADYKMDITGLTRIVRIAAQIAHIPGADTFTMHSLRRGRLQQLLEEGADMYDVEEELGWAHGGSSVAYRAEVQRQSPTAANARGML